MYQRETRAQHSRTANGRRQYTRRMSTLLRHAMYSMNSRDIDSVLKEHFQILLLALE